MIVKKIFSLAASIIILFIFNFFYSNSKADSNNIKQYSGDEGVLAIMYHRFNESKYPSTNIQMDIFRKQMEIVKNFGYSFYDPNEFIKNFDVRKKEKKILLTIDDAFLSFYEEAWPYLKKNKIPFILFVSTEPVNKNGYMSWDQIKEIENEKFVMIGHHSHSHEYLIDKTENEFIFDIEEATKIFLDKLGYKPPLFSYPFGEYSKFMKDYISKNFVLSFGQHSGLIDVNKDKYELPRFPINENYGKLDRFSSIINYSPLEYRKLSPEEKKLNSLNNPPEFNVTFFNEQKNIERINCYSNEGGKWEKSNITISEKNLSINFRGPFLPRRGRVNCSLNENGKWKWFGTQFTVILD